MIFHQPFPTSLTKASCFLSGQHLCFPNKADIPFPLSFPLLLDKEEQSLGLPVGKLPGCSLLSQTLPRLGAIFRSPGGRQWTGWYLMDALPPAKPCEQL